MTGDGGVYAKAAGAAIGSLLTASGVGAPIAAFVNLAAATVGAALDNAERAEKFQPFIAKAAAQYVRLAEHVARVELYSYALSLWTQGHRQAALDAMAGLAAHAERRGKDVAAEVDKGMVARYRAWTAERRRPALVSRSELQYWAFPGRDGELFKGWLLGDAAIGGVPEFMISKSTPGSLDGAWRYKHLADGIWRVYHPDPSHPDYHGRALPGPTPEQLARMEAKRAAEAARGEARAQELEAAERARIEADRARAAELRAGSGRRARERN